MRVESQIRAEDRPIKVYAGGPIDYSTGHAKLPHALIDALAFAGVEVYCPQCENTMPSGEVEPDDFRIMDRNKAALARANRAVFLLDGTFTVGTPVEIADWIKIHRARAAAIVHPGEPGLFVRMWALQGVKVFKTVEEAAAWLVA